MLHTGDFKMDQVPLDGRITDLAGFARLGAEGVDLLLSDSTNAEIPGFVTPERDIGPVLGAIFGKARGRIIVASFASHVHRVQQVMDAAYEYERKVALIGRSMVRNMGIARDLGLLRIPDGLLVSMDEATNLPPDEIVFMSTGSQGEPMSALGRMSTGDHRHITIESGRHRRAGQLAGAGQRDLGLPGDQPAGPGRRHRHPQGHRQGARLRPRPGR